MQTYTLSYFIGGFVTFLENRLPPPLIAVFFAAYMYGLASFTQNIEVEQSIKLALITVLLTVGVLFCFAGVLSFKLAKTTVNPLKPDTSSALVTSGIYRISRNPMYLGFSLFLLSWSIFLSSFWSLTGVIAYILYIQRFQIIPEERALRKLFGQKFDNYKSRVGRWL